MAKNNEDLAIKIVDVPTLPHVIIFLMPNFVDKKVQVIYINFVLSYIIIYIFIFINNYYN